MKQAAIAIRPNDMHELRNCLAVIRSTAEAHMLHASGPARSDLSTIIERTDRIAALLVRISATRVSGQKRRKNVSGRRPKKTRQ